MEFVKICVSIITIVVDVVIITILVKQLRK